MQNKIKIIISDIDGTLLNDDGRISNTNRSTLEFLKEKDIPVILATGRSLFSAKKVLIENHILDLIDFIIFSTGAAIYNVKNEEIFDICSLDKEKIIEVENYLNNDLELDYMIQGTIPNNHFFSYKKNNRFKINTDFYRRIKIYKDAILDRTDITNSATQFIAIIPNDAEIIFEQIKTRFQEKYSIIKTTSPLNKKDLWVEVFPKSVSKSIASINLLEKLGFTQNELITIGNDFNDMDLLTIGKKNYLLENAPEELKRIIINEKSHSNCKVAPSNICDGFSMVIHKNIIKTH